jgi:hypothetical protein
VASRETACFHRVSKRTIHRLPVVAIALSVLGLGYSTFAFVSLQAGALPFRWSQSQIPFAINVNGDPRITDGSEETALRVSFEAWQSVGSSQVSFLEDLSDFNRSRTDWQSDDIHLVMWDMDNSSGFFEGSGGLVAITPVDFDPSTGRILDADILFNGKNYSFSTDNKGGTFDVQNVATHEVGHFIGLDHSAVVGATMNPFANQNDTRLRSLDQDDIAGASAIYPLGAAPGAIAGQLVRANGQPISGAHVVAEDLDGRPASAGLSDGNGNFVIQGLDQGQYVVYAEPLDGPVRSNNFSTHTSGLTIDDNFGTTFFGAASGQAMPSNADRVSVSFGSTTNLPRTLVARSKLPTPMNINSINMTQIEPGRSSTLTIFGTGLSHANRMEVSGTGIFLGTPTFNSSSVSASVEVSANAIPQLHTVKVYNDLTGDAAVLTGSFEVRQAAPLLEGCDPTSGAPGVAVQMFGSNFHVGARVVIGNQVVNGYVNGDGLSFTVPGLTNGTYSIAVENPDGQFAKINDVFTVAQSNVTAPPPPSSPTSSGGPTATNQNTSTNSSAPAPATNTLAPSSGGGGGGGGGGCQLAPHREAPAPTAPFALGALLVLGLAWRRRQA